MACVVTAMCILPCANAIASLVSEQPLAMRKHNRHLCGACACIDNATFCQVVINNLDALIMEPTVRAVLASMVQEAPHLLAEIEALYKSRFDAGGDLASNALGPLMPSVHDSALLCSDAV